MANTDRVKSFLTFSHRCPNLAFKQRGGKTKRIKDYYGEALLYDDVRSGVNHPGYRLDL